MLGFLALPLLAGAVDLLLALAVWLAVLVKP
jgi:hypothetical protein